MDNSCNALKAFQAVAFEALIEQFSQVKADFAQKLGFEFDTQVQLCEEIPGQSGAGDFQACYSWQTDTIWISGKTLNLGEQKRTLVHELVHAMQLRYEIFWGDQVSGRAHTFEFGLTSAICKHLLDAQSTRFFQPYDFQDDDSYLALNVSPSNFDLLIKREWHTSISSVVERSYEIAAFMRRPKGGQA